MDALWHRSFRAHPSALSDLRRWVRECTQRSDLPPRASEELVIAVNEAGTNAVLHSGGASIDVEWNASSDGIAIQIRDGGVFRPARASSGGWEESGRGIPLMLSAADALEIVKGTAEAPGTVIRVRKRVRAHHVRGEDRRDERDDRDAASSAAG